MGRCARLPADSVAIPVLIERETQAYLNRDADAQATFWATHTDLSQRVSLENGQVVAANGDHAALYRGLRTGFRQLTTPDPAQFTHHAYYIRGEAAFVTFRQVMQQPARPTVHSQQVRYLERDGGAWTIVHSGVMYYQPMPE